jgi:hypothetical protein
MSIVHQGSKMMRILSVSLLVFGGIGTCTTLAEFGLLGWSESGEYFAWEQYGFSDGSGLPWAELTIVHTPDGIPVYQSDSFPSESVDVDQVFRGGGCFLRSVLLDRAEPLLDSLGIISGSTGQHLVHHPLCDFSVDPEKVSFYGWVVSMDYHGPEYLLTLDISESGDMQTPDWFPSPVLLQLDLEQVGGDRTLLASDSILVTGYEPVFGYRIQDVYTFMDRFVAVVLNTTVPGFEGSDGGFRVVTGILPGTQPRRP